MLCEGVLLYILLVKVFGGSAEEKVKYFYIFGWGRSLSLSLSLSLDIAIKYFLLIILSYLISLFRGSCSLERDCASP